MLKASAQTTVLYDADCGFCKRLLRQLLRWDARHKLRPVALQDAEADTLLRGMDAERKMASWHLVAPDGTIYSGGAALAPLLRLLPGGGPPAALFAALPPLTDRGYRFVARNRQTISRLTHSRRG
jgi:predicted DCC family thiol-disulfide oxidoreductase YuxK